MSAAIPQLPPRYLRTPEAARFLGLSGRTLEKHRTYGTGPRYSKLGGRVVYGLEDLQAWVDAGRAALRPPIPASARCFPPSAIPAVSPALRRPDAPLKPHGSPSHARAPPPRIRTRAA